MNVTAWIFLISSPLAVFIGGILLLRADLVLRNMASISKRALDGARNPVAALVMRVHERVTGNPESFWDRAFHHPEQFKLVLLAMRLQGMLVLLWAVVAMALAADRL